MKQFLAIIFLFTGITANAQNQLHLGQYMVHQPFINPASIGSYDQLGGALVYKNQWLGFEGAPTIAGLNFHTPLGGKKSFVGLTVLRDEIGVNTSTEVSGMFAYKLKTGLRSRLVFGLSATLNMVQSGAVTNIQDPGDPVFNGGNQMFAMPNFKFGTYFYRPRFYLGFAIPNLLENQVVYTTGLEGQTRFNFENLHYYLHTGYSFRLNEKNDLNASILVKEVAGASLQIDANLQYMWNKTLGVGASYRTSNELLAMLSYRLIPELLLSYGYEFNFTDIGAYSSGTHEILLTYSFVPPEKPAIDVPRF